MKAIWVLDDVEAGDGGLVVVQASHKSNVETPHDLATGVDDMGLILQPETQSRGSIFSRSIYAPRRSTVERRAEKVIDLLVCGACDNSVESNWTLLGNRIFTRMGGRSNA